MWCPRAFAFGRFLPFFLTSVLCTGTAMSTGWRRSRRAQRPAAPTTWHRLCLRWCECLPRNGSRIIPRRLQPSPGGTAAAGQTVPVRGIAIGSPETATRGGRALSADDSAGGGISQWLGSKQVSRRDFLKGALVLGASASFGDHTCSMWVRKVERPHRRPPQARPRWGGTCAWDKRRARRRTPSTRSGHSTWPTTRVRRRCMTV